MFTWDMILTKKDLAVIRHLVQVETVELIDQKIKERIGLLPTREEFFSKMDEIMGELKAIRQIVTIHGKQIPRNTTRIEKIEKIHPSGRHATI